MMTRWRLVELYIDKNLAVGAVFTSRDYAATTNVSRAVASNHLQAYLEHQRGPKATGKYVLKRLPGTRTASAQWSVGERALDTRLLGIAFSNDTKAKWMRAVEPDIRRIAAINPQAARRARNIISATFDGALKVLEAAVRT